MKEVDNSIKSFPIDIAKIQAHDYQLTGALLRLTLARKSVEGPYSSTPILNYLTQAAYVNSVPIDKGPLHTLIIKPTVEDINHLLYLADINRVPPKDDTEEQEQSGRLALSDRLLKIFHNMNVEKFKTMDRFSLPQDVIEEPIVAFAKKTKGEIFYFKIPQKIDSNPPEGDFVKGIIKKYDDHLIFIENGTTKSVRVDATAPVFIDNNIPFTGKIDHLSLLEAETLSEVLITAKFDIQNEIFSTVIPWQQVEISEINIENEFSHPPKITPPWAYYVNNKLVLDENSILLPIHFKEQGCMIGDDGFFSFGKSSPLMVSEQKKKIYTAGFYDPGVISTGVRYILTSRDVINSISSKEESLVIDPLVANGFQVWFDDTLKASEVTAKLKKDFEERGIAEFFTITPFYEYDFAKDLICQFQSDRDLFMLIGVIILLVAVCNIITLLLLLIHDKKTEIGIFLSLGASKSKIATIFALAGMFLGGISTIIGSGLAYITLKNIDVLIWILNTIEGREVFNSVFYGTKLPNEFSILAFTFIAISAPLLSLAAGLIPAIKACRLQPSQILRSE